MFFCLLLTIITKSLFVKNIDFFYSNTGNSDNILTVCLIVFLILKHVPNFADILSSFAAKKIMVDEFTTDLLMVF
jgi:hypothetical protein